MKPTLDEVTALAMQLDDEERQLLAETLIQSRWDPQWLEAWAAEADRRHRRLESGEDPGLSLDEFWSDED